MILKEITGNLRQIEQLKELGIPNLKEDSEGLTPVENEQGMFMAVKTERRWLFSEQPASFVPLQGTIEGFVSFPLPTTIPQEEQ